VVFIPKGRKKELYGKIREFLGKTFRTCLNEIV
jgi:REP element-mobilizing transposase RayT